MEWCLGCIAGLLLLLLWCRFKLKAGAKAKIGYKFHVNKGQMQAILDHASKTKTIKVEGMPVTCDCFALVNNSLDINFDDDGFVWHDVILVVSFTRNKNEYKKHEGLEVKPSLFIKKVLKLES